MTSIKHLQEYAIISKRNRIKSKAKLVFKQRLK